MTTQTRTYTPIATSLPGRMVAFFKANPHEELGIDDIVEKFEPASRISIHTLLASAIEHGLLVRGKDDDGDWIYQGGAAIVRDAGPVVGPAVRAAPAPRRAKRAPVEIDLTAVQVLDNVPLPGPAVPARKKLDWSQLLDRMSPGQAAELPAECRATLSAAIAKIHKEAATVARKFTLRVDKAAGTLRVWRIE